jgi:dihydroceramidase
MFMYLAYRGIRNCITEGHDGVFIVSFLGYLVVGSGSFFFHTTLKYPWQLVDELSMIYTTCIMFFASFARNKGHLYSTALGCTLFGLAVAITAYYHQSKDPVFHQFAYGVLTAALLGRSVWVMETGIRPRFKKQRARARSVKAMADQNGHSNGQANGNAKKHYVGEVMDASEQERQDKRDELIIKTMWSMIPWGLGIFLGGFAVWGLDNVYCSTFRTWRRELGLPWGIFLEGHGWW